MFFRMGDPDKGTEPNRMGFEIEVDPTRDAGGLHAKRAFVSCPAGLCLRAAAALAGRINPLRKTSESIR